MHDLDQARRALTVAARFGRPVLLLSAPGAGGYLGPAGFRALADQARTAAPDADARACLDCADEPGTALEALRLGLESVALRGEPEILEKVRQAAASVGARLEPPAADPFDMGRSGQTDDDLKRWLLEPDADDH